MSIAATASTTSPQTASTVGISTQVVGKDDFLKLLVAQMQNQDPLNPMEGTEFTAQLAQFSSLEYLQNINGSLSDLNTAQSTLHSSQAVSLIGKTVLHEGDTFSHAGESMSDIRFRLDDAAETVWVKIYDTTGRYVATVEMAGVAEGDHLIPWNGRNELDLPVADGVYRAEVLAVDASGAPLTPITYTAGQVSAVSFRGQKAYLQVPGEEIAFTDVIEVKP
ncbi:MAG: flagellar hook capping FlgD N-terminal domain-containing protein [Pseudomonadota bacterium]